MDNAQAQRNQEAYVRATTDMVYLGFPTKKSDGSGNGDDLNRALNLTWLSKLYEPLKFGQTIMVPRQMAIHYQQAAALRWTPKIQLVISEIPKPEAAAAPAPAPAPAGAPVQVKK